MGNRVHCPYCGWHGFKFLPAGAAETPNRLCPRCRSLERYRMLLLLLQKEDVFKNPIRLLDLAPRECFSNYAKTIPHITYISSDLNSNNAMVWSDLTKMGMAKDSFDLVICPHVLEHISNDHDAFSELYRLLSPTGFGLLMVSISGNATFELPAALPEDNDRLFGQFDHVRRYGMDIVVRMQTAGLKVTTLDMFEIFSPQICQYYGLYGDDRYYFRFSR